MPASLHSVGNPALLDAPLSGLLASRAAALARDRLIAALATELVIPHAAESSGLSTLFAEWQSHQLRS